MKIECNEQILNLFSKRPSRYYKCRVSFYTERTSYEIAHRNESRGRT